MMRNHVVVWWLPVDSTQKRSVMRIFEVWVIISLNEVSNKQPSCRWFETSRRQWLLLKWTLAICKWRVYHYCDVIMNTVASQITSLTVVYLTVNSDADQRKHKSSASLVFVWGIHRDRWIPRTKDQLRGKCFHLMTSSCGLVYTNIMLKGHLISTFFHSILWTPDACISAKYVNKPIQYLL